MPAQVEQVLHGGMDRDESLSLRHRLKSSHPPLSDSGRLMRLLGPIILILLSAVNRFRHHFPVSYWIASQLVRHDLPRLTTMASKQSPEEPLRSSPIPLVLQVNIHHLAILVHGPPQIMLLAFDLYEYFVNIERIAVAAMPTLQSPGVKSTELDAPEPDGLVADGDAALREQIFNISVAQVKSVVQPDGIAYDIGRESVAFISAHPPILAIWAS